MSFSQFARVYDSFNEEEVYRQWLEFTMIALDKQPQKVLDVACGTGKFAALIQPFVQEICAVDIDQQMIAMAKQNNPQQDIDFKQGNMLDLNKFDKDYQLVTCFADSLCFLENGQQVKAALEQMYQRLDNGGTLLFDVWTPYQIRQVFQDFNYFDTHESAAIMWDCEVDIEELQVQHFITIFEKQIANDLYERAEFILKERTYPLESYLQWINELEPQSVTVYRDFGQAVYDENIDQACDRWFVKVVKS